MKKLLIISPFFPPVNAADMHRVRQSLPYFRKFGYDPTVVVVDEKFTNSYSFDDMLVKTIPADTRIIKVKALPFNISRKLGFGSLSMRALFHYYKAVNNLLKKEKFDLIYFSTTAFHIMSLGPLWKKKFGIPFVLDFQDPWRNDFYLDKPKNERPPKFKFVYAIDKILEKYTVPKAAGFVSVSAGYKKMLMDRYPSLKEQDFRIIPFAANPIDFEVLKEYTPRLDLFKKNQVNLVYIGRGGFDLQYAVAVFFAAFRKGLEENNPLFQKIHFYFIGTSYAVKGEGLKTILPEAEKSGLGDYVTEITDRIPYFETLSLLSKADVLIVPGSTDTNYTASKIYPYILANKPLLSVFHASSSVVEVMRNTNTGTCVTFTDTSDEQKIKNTGEVYQALNAILSGLSEPTVKDEANIYPYSSEYLTKKQAQFFDEILGHNTGGLKRLLIISPYFPPFNSPDMQRIRVSLPYYNELGWEAEVLTVDEKYVEGFRDELLSKTIPPGIKVHRARALPLKIGRKFGLSSLSVRCYFSFKQAGNELLRNKKYDLVFFSTTAFHVCALGIYWKKKFGVPFIIDLQDPWRNDFFLKRPVAERPKKFKLDHTIHRILEARTMAHVSGVISVSQGYIDELVERYAFMKEVPATVITFSSTENDFKLVRQEKVASQVIDPGNGKINVMYMGAANKWFLPLIRAFFTAFHKNITNPDDYHFYFVGTDYTVGSKHTAIKELANSLGMGNIVTEVPQRIPYFNALATLMQSDILLVLGSLDLDYSASKIFNNIMAERPLFSIFSDRSIIKQLVEKSGAGIFVGITKNDTEDTISEKIGRDIAAFKTLHQREVKLSPEFLRHHGAYAKTVMQVNFFKLALEKHPPVKQGTGS